MTIRCGRSRTVLLRRILPAVIMAKPGPWSAIFSRTSSGSFVENLYWTASCKLSHSHRLLPPQIPVEGSYNTICVDRTVKPVLNPIVPGGQFAGWRFLTFPAPFVYASAENPAVTCHGPVLPIFDASWPQLKPRPRNAGWHEHERSSCRRSELSSRPLRVLRVNHHDPL